MASVLFCVVDHENKTSLTRSKREGNDIVLCMSDNRSMGLVWCQTVKV
jgi:hypothetical protein